MQAPTENRILVENNALVPLRVGIMAAPKHITTIIIIFKKFI